MWEGVAGLWSVFIEACLARSGSSNLKLYVLVKQIGGVGWHRWRIVSQIHEVVCLVLRACVLTSVSWIHALCVFMFITVKHIRLRACVVFCYIVIVFV